MKTIDAQGKSLGRVASETAHILMGKDRADYTKHSRPTEQVRIINASGLALSDRKLDNKEYRHYTGYPGGLRSERARHLRDRKGVDELIRRAVYGMLPDNKLRSRSMKQLEITE